jgi:hypothetical protein
MKTNIFAFFILIITLLCPNHIKAQQTGGTSAKSVLTLTETSVNFGYHVTGWQTLQLDQVRKLVGPNEILAHVPDDLEGSEVLIYFYGSMPFTYNASLGFSISDRKRETYLNAPRFRLGISYRGLNIVPGFFGREVLTRIDTVLNPVTGQENYIDSLHMTWFNFELASEQLFLDGSVVFGTNTERVFSVYAGAGIATGMPLMSNSFMRFRISHQRVTSTPDGKRTHQEGETIMALDESVTGDPYLALLPYVPFGFNVRLSKRNPFLSQISLFYEGRMGLHIRVLRETDNLNHFTRHHTLGVRVGRR